MKDFIFAALPWVALGIVLAFVLSKVKNKSVEKPDNLAHKNPKK